MTTLAPAQPSEASTSELTTFDFRSPGKMAREQVRSLEVAHETFARRWGSVLTNTLRALVHLELLGVQQLTFEDYVKSMPNPVVLGVVDLPPLPGGVLLELNVPMGLTMVDRMLGGLGRPIGVRRPTELEATLLREILEHGAEAIGETFRPFVEVEASLSSVEFNPHLVQTISPSEMVLVLVYSVAIAHGGRSDGIATLCYPFSLLQPAAERLGRAGWEHRPIVNLNGDASAAETMRTHLAEVDVDVSVTLRPSTITAADLAGIQPGDVIRLEHRVDEPVIGRLGGTEIFTARAGRHGRRRAIQILEWREQ
ncbi:MAG TPA: flagellar motor switch protein FliM [Acidimicrobiia bacterium]|jgi:flagellar motor switch protein FliM